MTLSELVPNLNLCQQLKAAGFPQDTAMYWQRSTMHKDHPVSVHVGGDNEIVCIEDFFEDICAAPTAGELEEWLMTKLPFSRRLSSIVVERVLLHAKDKEATYRVTGTGIGGLRINVGKVSVVSALTSLALEVVK